MCWPPWFNAMITSANKQIISNFWLVSFTPLPAQGPLPAKGSGLRVQGSGLRAQGSGFRAQGSELRVQGSGLRALTG